MNDDIYQAEIIERKREDYRWERELERKSESSFIVGIVAGMAALAMVASIVITIWTITR